MLRRTPNYHQQAQHPVRSTVLHYPNCDSQTHPPASIYDGNSPTLSNHSNDNRIRSSYHTNPPSPTRTLSQSIAGASPNDYSRQARSPKTRTTTDSEAKNLRRQRNTVAARKYRQRRLDRIDELEQALKESQTERDLLKVQVARWRGKAEALQALLGPAQSRETGR